ncbi:MAG: hypothetical protein KDA67_09570 [Rhodobacteraceae bacterium]|nr:hypothetical protein [Paracoccaceae bacterium]
MAQIPAICEYRGLVFPSALPAVLGISVKNSTSGCPRCQKPAPILNGYTAIINGMVTFITSPEYTLREKQLLIDTATAVAKGEIKAAEAARKLDSKNKESGRLLREWANFGLTFMTTMTAVATFILAYSQTGGNAPPVDLAIEKFEETVLTIQQPDKRMGLAPMRSIRPMARRLPIQPNLEEAQGTATDANPPYENRKTRRASIKKSRAKPKK